MNKEFNPALERNPADISFVCRSDLAAVLSQPTTFAGLLEQIEREIDAQVLDLETERGRKAIASLAYKIARTKTAIDDYGKSLNDEANARIKAVNATRNAAKSKLEALQERARKPLTDWEDAERSRQDKAEKTMAFLGRAGGVAASETAKAIAARIEALSSFAIDPLVLHELATEANTLKQQALDALRNGMVAAEKAEREAAELAELRAQAAEAARIIQAQKDAEAAKALRAEAERRIAEATDKALAAAAQASAEREKELAARAAEAERRLQEAQMATQGAIPAANISYTVRSVAFMQAATATPAQMEAIAAALSSQAGLSEATAMRVARLINQGRIPDVGILPSSAQ